MTGVRVRGEVKTGSALEACRKKRNRNERVSRMTPLRVEEETTTPRKREREEKEVDVVPLLSCQMALAPFQH